MFDGYMYNTFWLPSDGEIQEFQPSTHHFWISRCGAPERFVLLVHLPSTVIIPIKVHQPWKLPGIIKYPILWIQLSERHLTSNEFKFRISMSSVATWHLALSHPGGGHAPCVARRSRLWPCAAVPPVPRASGGFFRRRPAVPKKQVRFGHQKMDKQW